MKERYRPSIIIPPRAGRNGHSTEVTPDLHRPWYRVPLESHLQVQGHLIRVLLSSLLILILCLPTIQAQSQQEPDAIISINQDRDDREVLYPLSNPPTIDGIHSDFGVGNTQENISWLIDGIIVPGATEFYFVIPAGINPPTEGAHVLSLHISNGLGFSDEASIVITVIDDSMLLTMAIFGFAIVVPIMVAFISKRRGDHVRRDILNKATEERNRNIPPPPLPEAPSVPIILKVKDHTEDYLKDHPELTVEGLPRELIEQHVHEVGPSDIPLARDEFLCPNCKTTLGENDSSCPSCGALFTSDESVCPACDAVVSADDVFCKTCGVEFIVDIHKDERKVVESEVSVEMGSADHATAPGTDPHIQASQAVQPPQQAPPAVQPQQQAPPAVQPPQQAPQAVQPPQQAPPAVQPLQQALPAVQPTPPPQSSKRPVMRPKKKD